MKLLLFLLDNWDSILFVIVLIAAAATLLCRGGIKYFKYMLFTYVTDAEHDYGGGTGTLKKSAVISKMFTALPFIKFFLTEKQLTDMIDNALTAAKKIWAEDPDIKAYVEEKNISTTVIGDKTNAREAVDKPLSNIMVSDVSAEDDITDTEISDTILNIEADTECFI